MLSPSEIIAPLKLIATLVNEMDECEELCKHVHERLVVINDKLLAMEKQNRLPQDSVVRDYSTLVNDFQVFLTKHKSRPWVYRIVTTKRTVGKVKTVQERIHTLMLTLELIHMSAVADERAKSDRFRARQEDLIQARLTADATVAQAIGRVEQQYEALSVLLYELRKASGSGTGSPLSSTNRAGDDDTTAHERLLKTALDKVVRRSSVQVHTVPVWFCPPHDVEFDVKTPFASGSFGTVHHGRMSHMDVVVKCLLIETRTNEVAMARFRDEASLWFSFRHRNVLMMYGACDVSSPPFIVCELATNGNLFDYLSFRSNRPHTLRLLHEAASGLAYLHANRVVHGDLKGDNILVTADGCAKIADFSFSYMRALSASRNSVANVSAAGVDTGPRSAGAIRWRAPECLRGRSPTFASDVFSFGMCMIEVVGQEVPWACVDDVTVRELVKEGELPEQPAAMPDRMWDLVKRMCSLNPSNRPSLSHVMANLGEMTTDGALATALASTRLNHQQPVPEPAPVVAAASIPMTLEQAIAQDDAERVTKLLSSSTALEAPVNGWNVTPLIVAAATGAVKVTQMLLARGADTRSLTIASAKLRDLDDTGCTALHVAASAGHSSVVDALLRAKRDLIGVLSAKKRTAMYFAVRSGRVAVIEVLLRYGGRIDDTDADGDTLLHSAASFDWIEGVRVLLQHNANVHAKSSDGSTALHRAVIGEHVAIIEELLCHGARIDESNNEGNTPLHLAAFFGALENIRTLLQHKANIHAIDSTGATALHHAVGEGHVGVIEELLRRGARIEEPDEYGDTPLHWAAPHGQLESARVLLRNQANIHAKSSSSGSTALHYATAKGHVAIIDELLRHGARIDEVDGEGNTPLHVSALEDELESARTLLRHNASVDVMNNYEVTALHYAVEREHSDVVQMLLDAGATVTQDIVEMASKSRSAQLKRLLNA